MVGKIGLFQSIPAQVVSKPVVSKAVALSADASVFHEQVVHNTPIDSRIAIGGLIALGVGAAAALVTRKIKAGKVLSELKFKEQVSKLYDEGWERLVAETGEQVGPMKKPELQFSLNNKTTDITVASYKSSENIIHIDLDFFKKHNYFVYVDSGGRIKIPAKNEVLFSKEEIAQMRVDGIIDETFKVKKVTQEEMLLAMQTLLAHEQRHAVQMHTALNDSTIGPEKLLGILVEDLMRKNRYQTITEPMEQAIKQAPYWANYDKSGSIPNRVLVTKIPYKDTSLKLSGKTIKDSLEAYSGSVANDAYHFNLLELDANAWANHCLSPMSEPPIGCSREFFEGLKLASSHIEQQTNDFFTRATLI